MNKSQKLMLLRIVITILLFISVIFGSIPENDQIFIFLGIYFIIGWDVLLNSLRNILGKELLDENVLMTIATLGAFLLGEYHEGVEVMLFYQIGELFQSYAVEKSRQSISDMMNICPEYANVEENGLLKKVNPDDVGIDDVIVIKPGEKIPLDGVVLEGNSLIDTMALTGESVPSAVTEKDKVLSGCINLSQVIKVRVTKPYEDSTVAKILELVEEASEKKAKTEKFITKFAHYYTPAVVISAVLLALVPPLILQQSFIKWIQRALIFLVISCPCALVISVPLGFFGGIGGASKAGILIKGGNYLEALSKAKTVVFDKTGTLTKGVFEVIAIHPEKIDEKTLLEFAALAEGYSNHPIAISIRKFYGKDLSYDRMEEVEEIAGCGMKASIMGKTVYAGNEKLMEMAKVKYHNCNLSGTIVHIAIDDCYAGHIIISDEVKKDSETMINRLKKQGIQQVVMLTGDGNETARVVAGKLNVDKVFSQLLPNHKVSCMEELLSQKGKNETVVFVGDGINDAPVLSRADVGIAMGVMGSDAAIEAADIVLMDDSLMKIPLVFKIAKKTMHIVKQNIFFALGIKFAVLILGAVGIAGMQLAVFADVGVAILAILNSFRTMRMDMENKM